MPQLACPDHAGPDRLPRHGCVRDAVAQLSVYTDADALGNEHDHAELVIAGLDPAIGWEILNDLAARVCYGGLRVTHEQRIDLLAGYQAVIVEGEATEQLLPGTAIARYGADRVRLAQIVWPCPHHRFPWQDGYCHPAGVQPLLTRP
jgi:Domain of unknown function (DUF4262)